WSLPPDKVAEIIDFVDFFSQQQQQQSLVYSTTKLSETAFEKIWDNPEDDNADN
ncbi:MAG: toxin-antitoxin system, antitoxin component, Xre family protein, partial [Okeania sp. SIO3C4]|nr:toxin-antitoxin system, antitoxin component, Xre family protein [Okeania sp. SIO3C4]